MPPSNRSIVNILSVMTIPFALMCLHSLNMHNIRPSDNERSIEEVRSYIQYKTEDLRAETDPEARRRTSAANGQRQ
jgi:hypothetical protein